MRNVLSSWDLGGQGTAASCDERYPTIESPGSRRLDIPVTSRLPDDAAYCAGDLYQISSSSAPRHHRRSVRGQSARRPCGEFTLHS
jgi:hypothetical protein